MIFTNNNLIIIGIDHGYGNIKTAHCCFRTGVAAYDKEPTFKTIPHKASSNKRKNMVK